MAINTPNKTKKFNPTITRLFPNEKFGKGALKSATIDAEAFKTIQQSLEIGSSLVARKSPKLDKNGGEYFFLEILPPMTAGTQQRNRTQNDDSI